MPMPLPRRAPRFRRRLAAALLGLLGCLLAASATAEAGADTEPRTLRNIVLAPTLFESTPDEIRSQLGPARFIEELTGHPVVVENHARYEDIISGFVAGRIDLAILGPLPYVSLRQLHAGAEPLVRFREPDGREHYTCTLVAFADEVRPLPRYVGARLALTQPFSTCGYFAAATLLGRAGVDIERLDYRFVGRHDQIAIEVITGGADLGVLKDEVAARFASVGLVELAATRPLPGFTLIANAATLDAATRQRLREGFLALQEADIARFVEWPRTLRRGAVPAAHEDYDAIARQFMRIEAPLQQAILREKEQAR